MGWSHTQDAGKTMVDIENACSRTRVENGGELSSNVFFAKGKRYFYETTRRDQEDGGIAGAIYLCVGDDMARKVSTFRIDGQGIVTRGPALFRHAVRRAVVADGKAWLKRDSAILFRRAQEREGKA